jgi:hypothetical protein
MPFVAPQFEGEGDAGQAFNAGQNSGMSMMERAQQMEQRGAQEERQKAIFQAGLPLLQAKNQADLAEAHDKMAQFVDLQDQRQQILPILQQARNQFNKNQLIPDINDRAAAGTQWLGKYAQIANIPEYKSEFDTYNHLSTQTTQDQMKIATLANQNDMMSQKLKMSETLMGDKVASSEKIAWLKYQPPIIRTAAAYQNAMDNGDTELAGMIKQKMDKDAGLVLPISSQSEYQKLSWQLSHPTPEMPANVVLARMNELVSKSGTSLSLPQSDNQPAASSSDGQSPTAKSPSSSASQGTSPVTTPNPTQSVQVSTATPKVMNKTFEDISKQRDLLDQNQFSLARLGQDIKAEQESTLGSGPVVGSDLVVGFRPTARQVREDIGDFANRIMSTVKNIRNVREFNAVTAAIPKASDPAEVQNNKLERLNIINGVLKNRNDEMEKVLRADGSLSPDQANQIAAIKFPFPGVESNDQSALSSNAPAPASTNWAADKEARYQEWLKNPAKK